MANLDLIKYEGDNNTFVWKHPCEDFNTRTTLVVHESQEAVFFVNGQAVDILGPGKHVLETEKLPLLKRLLNLATGNVSTFHCEVYFVNKAVQMALRWGTDSRVRFIEPNYGIPLEIGASGEMNLAVSDSTKLLNKLVGTAKGISWGSESEGFTKSLQSCFRPLISTAVKTNLSTAIKANNINLFEIDESLDKLSEALRLSMLAGFEEYGLTIPQLYVTNVLLPEEDANFRKMKELYTTALQIKMVNADALIKSAQADAEAGVIAARRQIDVEKQKTETEIAKHAAERTLIHAQAKAEAKKLDGFAEAEIMRAKGYSQKDVFEADVLSAYAQGLASSSNETVGTAVANTVAAKLEEITNGNKAAEEKATETGNVCPKCGTKLPTGAKFCLECGEKL